MELKIPQLTLAKIATVLGLRKKVTSNRDWTCLLEVTFLLNLLCSKTILAELAEWSIYENLEWIQGKVVNLESMVSVHCTTLLRHVTTTRTSCFDTDFISQMKLTTLPLIHCFVRKYALFGSQKTLLFELHLCIWINNYRRWLVINLEKVSKDR